jgi:hypothetical protein
MIKSNNGVMQEGFDGKKQWTRAKAILNSLKPDLCERKIAVMFTVVRVFDVDITLSCFSAMLQVDMCWQAEDDDVVSEGELNAYFESLEQKAKLIGTTVQRGRYVSVQNHGPSYINSLTFIHDFNL